MGEIARFGRFPFGHDTRVGWRVDPDARRTISVALSSLSVPGGMIPIRDQDDDHGQGAPFEIRRRITVAFSEQINQLPIRVTMRILLQPDLSPTAAPNYRKVGDALYCWDEWNDFNCPARSLEVNANNCWFHQTGWNNMEPLSAVTLEKKLAQPRRKAPKKRKATTKRKTAKKRKTTKR